MFGRAKCLNLVVVIPVAERLFGYVNMGMICGRKRAWRDELANFPPPEHPQRASGRGGFERSSSGLALVQDVLSQPLPVRVSIPEALSLCRQIFCLLARKASVILRNGGTFLEGVDIGDGAGWAHAGTPVGSLI